MDDTQSVTILEDWNERADGVYYRWKRVDEDGTAEEGEWHEKLTPFKQKPVVYFKRLSKLEYYNQLAPPKKEGK